MGRQQELPLQGIVELASAFYGSATLFAAIETDVFTAIAKLGARATAETVAEAAGASARPAAHPRPQWSRR